MKFSIKVSLFLSLALIGCAHTNVSSYRDPIYVDVSCSAPIIMANIAGLEHQQAIEDSFVDAFNKSGIHAVRGIDMWPPTRDMPTEEKVLLFLKSESDCIVKVSLSEGTRQEQEYHIKVVEKTSLSGIWIGDSSTTAITDTADSIATRNLHMSAMFDSLASGVTKKLIEDGVLIPK